ncbi:cupin domain-containing protein [Alicyclobacillus macrosporangiidus]|uniref:cupin domain-containing protein n=1 Tax=Alicyclobacillus macrosporangiidus TaxID=392015 RepID=UPI0004979BA5|nr:cupin domain-containing protein [Alicyclobacillus macrosporangiidus]
MKLFRFDAEVGRPVTAFGSDHTVLTRILKTTAGVQIGCMHLQRGGVIGLHQAVGPQLFLVVQGEGWVRGKEAKRTVVRAGHAVFWESGEWHETRTESGLTAIVIEGEELNPEEYMSLVE